MDDRDVLQDRYGAWCDGCEAYRAGRDANPYRDDNRRQAWQDGYEDVRDGRA